MKKDHPPFWISEDSNIVYKEDIAISQLISCCSPNMNN